MIKPPGRPITILYELQDYSERMNPITFCKLLGKVKPLIEKQETRMKDSITAEAQLEAALLFPPNGCTYRFLQYICCYANT